MKITTDSIILIVLTTLSILLILMPLENQDALMLVLGGIIGFSKNAKIK